MPLPQQASIIHGSLRVSTGASATIRSFAYEDHLILCRITKPEFAVTSADSAFMNSRASSGEWGVVASKLPLSKGLRVLRGFGMGQGGLIEKWMHSFEWVYLT